MTDLATLYRIGVDYYPPEGNYTWGSVELTFPGGKKWCDAWERATWAEKVRHVRWHADVISRVAVGACAELQREERLSLLESAYGVLKPVEDLHRIDAPSSVSFKVPDESAKQWVARTKELIREVIADDQDAALPPIATPDHQPVHLAEHATETKETRT